MTHTMALDIHDFEHRYQQTQEYLGKRTDVSDHNKALILKYRDACVLHQVCGKVRLIRVLIILGRCAVILGKDFETVTREDVEHIVSTLMSQGLRPATMATYKSVLKRFLCYALLPNDFPKITTPPPQVAWMRTHVRRADQHRLARTELLTPQDIKGLFGICHNPRDTALIAVLWETGGRIGEVGNLQLKHVLRSQHGYSLDLSGKTGERNPLIISSAPALTQWLANHPFRDQPDAPLWVHYQYTDEPRHLKYASIRYLLIRYFARAKVAKPFHPHIFRHSRATYVLAAGLMNESQAKSYFGWTPDSKMLATYSHLIDQDANNAILRENNLTPARQQQDLLKPLLCHVCKELNVPEADYCTKCNAVLNLKRAYEHQQLHSLKDDVVLNLVQILVEKGLLDDAARAIHDAGLGNALKQLAAHHANNPCVPTTAAQPQDRFPTGAETAPLAKPARP